MPLARQHTPALLLLLLVGCATAFQPLRPLYAGPKYTRTLRAADPDDASGPVVKDSDLPKTIGSEIATVPAAPVLSNATLAELFDQALQKEFSDETIKASAVEAAKQFNVTVESEEGVLETVIRISSKNKDSAEEAAATGHNTTSSDSDSPDEPKSLHEVSAENAVDRIIDNKNNEFVLSKVGSDPIASLLVDPQLIQDITAILATCAVFGVVFEALQQPVINGYLIAGAVLGPGGMQVIQELVQVESLAQIGVQLLLFNLGLELSLSKLRAVYGVAICGGFMQILLCTLLTGTIAAVGGVSVSQGIFIGALLSMSSTSVVVKCLETTRSTNTQYGQITIGTLILQDCFVGVMFALMPVFKPRSPSATPLAAGEYAEHCAAVIVTLLQVAFKLAAALALAMVLAKTLLALIIRLLYRFGSCELVQLCIVAFCLSIAWTSDRFGISSELGAFIAGAMVSHAVTVAGVTSAGQGSSAQLQAGSRGDNSASLSSSGSSLASAHGAVSHTEPHKLIESLHNVMTALFVASIGLVMSPTFLWDHIIVLTAATLCVVVFKALLISCVVRAFGIGYCTSLAIGITMAHVGEFSLVLLSIAMQLKILSAQMYMLLLGVTALSLLTTPMVIMLSSGLLRDRLEPATPGSGRADAAHSADNLAESDGESGKVARRRGALATRGSLDAAAWNTDERAV